MIFYFSGTGNTRWVAQQIAEATGEQLMPMDVTSQGTVNVQLAADERLGICFPVHGWRPPVVVRNWVRRLVVHSPARPFCYAFATAGDDVGLTFDYLREDLASADITLDSIFSVIMPDTYHFPLIDQVDKPEDAVHKIAKAARQLPAMIDDIVARKQGVVNINESHWPRINSQLLGSFFIKHWVTDSKFSVDPALCLHCGKCERVCPVGDVKCQPEPRWLHNGYCTTCLACFHYCPAHAIDFAGRTRGKRQYYFTDELLRRAAQEPLDDNILDDSSDD